MESAIILFLNLCRDEGFQSIASSMKEGRKEGKDGRKEVDCTILDL